MNQRRIPRWIGWPLLLIWTYVVLTFFANRAIFHPLPYPEGFWEVRQQLGAEDVWFETSDGVRIHGWMAPAPGDSPWLTIYFHGNGGNLTYRGAHLAAIRQAGSGVLIVSYRGYGKSEGSPSEEGIYRDADAAYDYLLTQGVSAGRIIVHGESLGSAVAADLASRRDCGGLVLEAPFPSASAVADTLLPGIGRYIISGLETAEKIRNVHVPVLIIHGDRDDVIDYKLGVQVFEAAHEPKQLWTVPGAGHNDLVETAGADYVERLRAFYGSLRDQPAAGAAGPSGDEVRQ